MLQQLKEELNYGLTENGAVTHRSTLNECLDFFGLAGAMRKRSNSDILDLFKKSFYVDPSLTVKLLFYFRDIRGGQGERKLFRVCLNWLGDVDVDKTSKLFPFIAEHGRWDDFYCLVNTKTESVMFDYLNNQLKKDYESPAPSLLAKWLKSENASSSETKFLAKKTKKAFNFSSNEYRQL